ncbi:hypothetical protein M8J75_003990 [Diaphorina citri]|nr:hypothetical protein M8J75_003990 [Diaphorina citri]
MRRVFCVRRARPRQSRLQGEKKELRYSEQLNPRGIDNQGSEFTGVFWDSYLVVPRNSWISQLYLGLTLGT